MTPDRTLPPTLLALLLALAPAAFGCGDDGAGGHDGGSEVDAGRRTDGGRAGTDSGVRGDAGPRADGGVMPPAGWAPLGWEDCEGGGRMLEAGPSDYRTVLDTLMPGDTLRLGPGMYTRGLPVRVSGEPGRCIVIEGTPGSARPLILGSDSFNLISFRAVGWVKVRGLDLDGMGMAGDGVKSEGGESGWAHHIVVEDLHLVAFGGDQQTVGISTKSPCWDWVIRGNTILGAGTGLYLGNSDGNQPFIRGLVELNVVLDTIGYNMQIKHQVGRPVVPGIPTEPAETTVRYNVFSKQRGGSSGGSARPNFLLGHLPTSGEGSTDRYVVYGNFFYENPDENLVQAEGNVAFYANVLVNRSGGAATFQPHNDVPRQIDFFLNTVVATGRPVRVTGGDPSFTQRVFDNAVFAAMPISASDAHDNFEGSVADAESMLASASADPGAGLDLHPTASSLAGRVDLGSLGGFPNANLDFDGRPRDGAFLGAYAGPATAASWPLALERRALGR